MPDKLSVAQFAQTIRDANPAMRGYDDDTVVNSFLRYYPDEASRLERRTPAQQFLDKAIETGARVVPTVVGAAAGSALGPFGTAAGGAAGAGLGEWLAEAYESRRGDRTGGINPKQIAVQSAIGAIPIAGEAGGNFLTAIAKRGLQGAALGGVSSAATQLAEGQQPTLKDVGTAAALGSVLGGAGGAVENRLANQVAPQIERTVPRLQQLEEARQVPEAATPVADYLRQKGENAVTRFVNQFRPIESFVKEGGAENLPADTNPVKRFDLAYGGTPGKVQDFAGQYRDIYKDAQDKGLSNVLQDYLDLQGMATGVRTLRQKARMALDQGSGRNVAEGLAAVDRRAAAQGQVADILSRLRGSAPVMQEAADLPQDAQLNIALSALKDDPRLRQDLGSTAVNTLKQAAAPAPISDNPARNYFQKIQLGGALPVGYTQKTVGQDLGKLYMRPDLQPQQVFETQKLGQQVFDLNRRVLDISHDAGIVPDAVYQNLASRPDQYVPLERIMDEVSDNYRRSGMDLPTQHTLFSLEGSSRATQDPFSASVRRAGIAIQEAEKNKATQSLVNLRSQSPFFADNILPLKPGDDVPKDFGKISVFVNGQAQHYAVPQPVADAVKNVDGQTADLLAKSLLGWGGRTLRTFATQANLAFSVPNVIRDVQDAAVYDKNFKISQAAQDWFQAFKQVWNESPEYRRFLQSGGAFSTLQKTISDPQRFLDENQNVLSLLHPVKSVETLNNVLEESTKLSYFNRQIRNGASDLEAGFQTRRFGGSPDFARHGTDSQTLNKLVPFVNAQIQGITRSLSYFAQNPQKLGYALAGATGASLLLQSWNNQFTDPDGTPSWQRISDRDKQSNFIFIRPDLIKTSDGTVRHAYIKIPKGHVAQLLMDPIQSLIDSSVKDKSQALLDVASNMAPGAFQVKKGDVLGSTLQGAVASLNPILKTPIEQAMGPGGISTYQGIPIVPGYLQDVAPNEQVRPDTSPAVAGITQTINKTAGTRFSPIRVEAALKNFFPGLGDVGLSAANQLFRTPEQDQAQTRGPQPTFEKDEAIGRLPIVGPVAKRFLTSTLDQADRDRSQNFYNALTKAREIQQTVSVKAKQNPQDLRDYLQDPQVRFWLGRAGSLERISQVLTQLRQVKDQAGERRVLAAAQALIVPPSAQ